MVGSYLLVLALFYAMRRTERILRQHVFKVGWLLTKNLQTTTIIFYLVFLPGVVLHEFVLWLMAGFLNVRAERALQWPEAQAMAELRLTFVKISRSAGAVRLALIAAAPFITGVLFIWYAATEALRIPQFITVAQAGGLDGMGSAVRLLVNQPNFALWVYLILTVANTMLPDPKMLTGWRSIAFAVGIGVILLWVTQAGQSVFQNALLPQLGNIAEILLVTLPVIVLINLLSAGLLGAFEAVYERLTGDSATFQNGKLVAMRRAELIEQKRQQAARTARAKIPRGARENLSSIYQLPFPLPPARSVVRSTPPRTSTESRAGASLIEGRLSSPAQTAQEIPRMSGAAHPPARRSPIPPDEAVDDEREDELPDEDALTAPFVEDDEANSPF